MVGGLWSIGGLNLEGVSVVDLLADLLGEGELHSLAVWGSKTRDALVNRLRDNLDLWDSDALLLGEILAADSWKADWLVDTGLDWLGVGDGDSGGDNGDHRVVVAGLLGDLLAVVVSVTISSVSVSWLADGHHHGLAGLLEGDLDSLAGGLLVLGLVGVAAHLVVNLLNALGTDSSGDSVALLDILDRLSGQFNWSTGGVNMWGAHISLFNNIEDTAVVLGVLVAIGWLVVGGGGVVASIGWGGSIGRGVAIGWGGVVGLGGHTSGQGGDEQTEPSLGEKTICEKVVIEMWKVFEKIIFFKAVNIFEGISEHCDILLL